MMELLVITKHFQATVYVAVAVVFLFFSTWALSSADFEADDGQMSNRISKEWLACNQPTNVVYTGFLAWRMTFTRQSKMNAYETIGSLIAYLTYMPL